MTDFSFDAHFVAPGAEATPITALFSDDVSAWTKTAPAVHAGWVAATDFQASGGQVCLLAGDGGHLERVLFGLGPKPPADQADDPDRHWFWADLASKLPRGTYVIESPLSPGEAGGACLAFGLGGYTFKRFKSKGEAASGDTPKVQLVWPEAVNQGEILALGEATYLCRDLINTPPNHMGPAQLSAAAERVALDHGADIRTVVGDALLSENYPAIHAVGRASDQAPRLIDLTWGPEDAPKVTLVGKGVCFDTGGLDLKPASGMKLMKKDMGGAAHVLGIAHILMALNLTIRLRVLIPAVENSVSGNAMRPLDVVESRAGKSIEISNTDAEGRVILADALTLALEDNPALILDFATLTGAARVALGAELPALFVNDDHLAADILSAGTAVSDPLWRMPLWPGYRAMVDAKTADLDNAPEGGLAGAITAALFLESFVGRGPDAPPWAHVDVMAWNNRKRLGRPVGGEAMGMRAMATMIRNRFG